MVKTLKKRLKKQGRPVFLWKALIGKKLKKMTALEEGTRTLTVIHA